MNRLTITALSCAVLSACAATPPVVMTNSFDAGEVAWAQGSGSNALQGNALLRTVGGDVKTCAGFAVLLFPSATYTDELMMHWFGNTSRGGTTNISNPALDPGVGAYTRRATCDAQGNFTFSNLPDGDYYVMTEVTWGVPTGRYYTSQQGGALMQRVSLHGGQTENVVLTS